MSEIVLAEINSFGTPEPKADFVPPCDQLITLTIGQFQDLITEAVEKALQPLQDRISTLEATVAHQEEKIVDLEATQDTHAENQLIQLQLINQLREATAPKPQPLQKDRADVLKALLVANNGKLLAKQARQKMRVPKSSFSELLKTCDFIEIRPYHLDSRQDILVLKSQLLK